MSQIAAGNAKQSTVLASLLTMVQQIQAAPPTRPTSTPTGPPPTSPKAARPWHGNCTFCGGEHPGKKNNHPLGCPHRDAAGARLLLASLPQLNARQLSTALQAAAYLQLRDATLLGELCSHSARRAETFALRDVVSGVYSLGRLRWRDEALARPLLERAEADLVLAKKAKAAKEEAEAAKAQAEAAKKNGELTREVLGAMIGLGGAPWIVGGDWNRPPEDVWELVADGAHGRSRALF